MVTKFLFECLQGKVSYHKLVVDTKIETQKDFDFFFPFTLTLGSLLIFVRLCLTHSSPAAKIFEGLTLSSNRSPLNISSLTGVH